jgi:transketolase
MGTTRSGHRHRRAQPVGQPPPACPKALVARTVKGKGVPFMEHQNQWHYTRLNEQTFAEAMATVAAGWRPS